MRFDLVSLNLVLAIAESRSITAGAEREHLALAAASKRLSDLESRLGVQLFERRPRGVELTDAGRAFVRHVRGLHACLNGLENELAEYSHGVRGHLRVVSNASAISECLPPDLAAFSRAHPDVRISLEDQTSAEVQRSLAEGLADVGIFVPPQSDPRIQAFDYREGQLDVIAPHGHALAVSGRVTFESLLDFDFVGLHSGAAVQQQMLAQATEQGRTLRTRVQVRGFDAIAQLVESGLGIAIMPSAVAERLSRVFALHRLTLDESWARRRYLIGVRQQEVLPGVVRRFVDFLSAAGAAVPGDSVSEPPVARPV